MNLKLLFSFFVLALTGISACKDKQCVEQECMGVCTMEYKPVCGCNQTTYSNACTAECHGIIEYTQGEC